MSEKPLCFPMKFKEFLRRAIGGRLYADRLHIFRRYWDTVLLKTLTTKDMTDDNRSIVTDATVTMLIQNGVDSGFYRRNTEGIKAWRQENQRQQRIDAANKRWHPKKAKKRLTDQK